ncbi:VOC family protein [Microterricola pindariensis]|nr:VOC family protein [Microterricola pindariensis]
MAMKSLGAFSGFAVRDVAAARSFYADALGLPVADDRGGLRLELPGDSGSVFVYEKADHEPAVFTILNFAVGDIDTAVDDLEAAGVSMLHYDGFQQDERGVARDPQGPAIAWFTDPSGNILAVLQPD